MQDYKLLLRTITEGASNKVHNSQNASEFMSYLNEEYLAHGYEIQSITFLRVVPFAVGEPTGFEFAYHLVKELNTASKVK